jgi:S1-C subfamily serine protease
MVCIRLVLTVVGLSGSVSLFGASRQPSAVTIYQTAAPSVVAITVENGLGSGFIVSADGMIVTNFHVISQTRTATVQLAEGDSYDDVQVLDVDKRKDIGVIKIKAVDLPFLKLGSSTNLEVGEVVYSLGTPNGYQTTLSQGLISGVRVRTGFDVFQFTAPISGGSSGGPLLNARGEVIGITTESAPDGQNLNFAVPIDYVRGMLVHPGEPKTLASVYDPSGPVDLTRGKQTLKGTTIEQGKAFAGVVGAIALGLLVVWFLARWTYIAWRRNNEAMRYMTVLGRLWVRVGSPALLCVAIATVIGLVIRTLYLMEHPQ